MYFSFQFYYYILVCSLNFETYKYYYQFLFQIPQKLFHKNVISTLSSCSVITFILKFGFQIFIRSLLIRLSPNQVVLTNHPFPFLTFAMLNYVKLSGNVYIADYIFTCVRKQRENRVC